MRLSRICFVLAGLFGFCAAGLVAAQTTSQSYMCFPTPMSTGCSCGCPVPGIPQDTCIACTTTPGQPANTWYYCASNPNFACTAPTTFCGGKVYNCPSCPCFGPWPAPCDTTQCTDTSKQDLCTNYYGCTNS